MSFRRRLVLFALVLLMGLGTVGGVGSSGTIAQSLKQPATTSEYGPSGFVVGPNRIMVHQTQVVADGAQYGLAASAGNRWVVSILDFTNFGTAAQPISVGDFSLTALDGDDAIASDKGQGPSAELAFADVQADGSATVPVDSTIRIAVAFSVPEAAVADFEPQLEFGEERTTISSTVVDTLDATGLEPVQPWVGAQGVVQGVPGKGTIEVNVGGAVQTVSLSGVTTPPADGCFGAESSATITTLSGGSVWVEDDPTSDGSLVWYWDGGRGHLVLLNQVLIEQGFADAADGSGYASWLGAKADQIEDAGTGLWELCKDADGEWINPPTPTPVPTKTADEIRADYEWVDARDLIIRPDSFTDEKIAIQGEVFNIMVDADGFATIQIYASGTYEAVMIAFDGDTTGVYEGTWVTVYGTAMGTYSFENIYGATLTQPLIYADIVDR
jgi:hypothetical protein